MTIPATNYTPADAESIPTGQIQPVKGTPLDFNQPTRIGDRIDQLKPRMSGYDHNYILGEDQVMKLAARLVAVEGGRESLSRIIAWKDSRPPSLPIVRLDAKAGGAVVCAQEAGTRGQAEGRMSCVETWREIVAECVEGSGRVSHWATFAGVRDPVEIEPCQLQWRHPCDSRIGGQKNCTNRDDQSHDTPAREH